jgi:hypothetical protein
MDNQRELFFEKGPAIWYRWRNSLEDMVIPWDPNAPAH